MLKKTYLFLIVFILMAVISFADEDLGLDSSSNLIENSNFSQALLPSTSAGGDVIDTEKTWQLALNTDSAIGDAIIENGKAQLDISSGAGGYNVQLLQVPVNLENGATYKVSFEASSLNDGSEIVFVLGGGAEAGWGKYLEEDFVLSTEMESYEIEFEMFEDDEIARVEIWILDNDVYHFDNIEMNKIAQRDPDEDPVERTYGEWVYDGDAYFIFNIAVGGQWPGNPDGTTEFPQTMEVDYIRIFDENGNLEWSDEFDGTEVNRDNWNFEIGNGHANGIPGWGNNELQYYTDGDNAEIVDDKLVITAKEESRTDEHGTYDYTSTRMTTSSKVNMEYGRVEIRAKLPEGQGIWPALWMLGENITDVGWPDCGEIDIMELVGHLPDEIHGTVHGPGYSGGGALGNGYTLSDGKFSDDFNTFILEWEEDEIRWFVNDEADPFHIVRKDADGQIYSPTIEDDEDEEETDITEDEEETDITEGEVVNGAFDEPIVDDQEGSPDNWFVWAGEGGVVNNYGVENGEFKIDIPELGNQAWAIQFNQFIKLIEGNYELSFEARAEDERDIIAMVQEDGGSWTVFGETTVDLTNEMQEYSFDVSLADEETPKLNFQLGNTENGVATTVYIDNVSIKEVETDPVEEPDTELATGDEQLLP
ncbi:MAG: carbohydrate binding domain-containing protein [Halanaerobiaceae bacterium]